MLEHQSGLTREGAESPFLDGLHRQSPAGQSQTTHSSWPRCEQVVGLDALLRCVSTSSVLWFCNFQMSKMLTSPNPLTSYTVQPKQQPTGLSVSCKVCLAQWDSWEKPRMAFKEAKSWLSALSRGIQGPRRLACCASVLAGVPSLAWQAVWTPDESGRGELTPLPRHSPDLPCSPLSRRATGMGQLRQLEADAAHHLGEISSRSAICWVQGRQRQAAPVVSHARKQVRHFSLQKVSPLYPGLEDMPLLKKAVSRKSWLVLQNLIVTGMRNSKRVTLRKARLLNGSWPLPSEPCHYSVMLLHGTQKVTVGGLCFSRLQDASWGR